ncbi:hypothetical protein VTK56DRAFT_7829 [Thermocarpiscus australiensis]
MAGEFESSITVWEPAAGTCTYPSPSKPHRCLSPASNILTVARQAPFLRRDGGQEVEADFLRDAGRGLAVVAVVGGCDAACSAEEDAAGLKGKELGSSGVEAAFGLVGGKDGEERGLRVRGGRGGQAIVELVFLFTFHLYSSRLVRWGYWRKRMGFKGKRACGIGPVRRLFGRRELRTDRCV